MKGQWGFGPPGGASCAASPRVAKPTPAALLRAFDPDRVIAPADLSTLAPDEPSHAMWRCRACEPSASVCCRVGVGRRCICSHKYSSHDRARGMRCTEARCGCRCFAFHVQVLREMPCGAAFM